MVALVVLLSVLVAHPAAVGAVSLAGIAVLQRWGTPSLEAVAGAQSVLGAGGVVGPEAAAASAWFTAAALVLATPHPGGDDADPTPASGKRRRPATGTLVAALALGAAAAAAVVGPDFDDGLVVRLAGTAVAVVLATVVASLRHQKVTAVLALVAGVLAAAFATVVASGRVGL